MNMSEEKWDKKLKIRTIGRDDSAEDVNHYPYEPTPYSVLQRLSESGYLTSESCVVDYGCGKGRVDFYLSYSLGCHTIGIELDGNLYQEALENKVSCIKSDKVSFVHTAAEEYIVDSQADCFYFFNPFSLKILKSVIGKVIDSWYGKPRNMLLFFYYPSDEYVSYLMTVPEFEFLDEIDCADLFEGNNKRERIMMFEVTC